MTALQCVFCLFTGVPTLDREPDEDDEPLDGLAVTIVGGTAVCGWHVNAVIPDDVQWLIGKFGEEQRKQDARMNP